VCWFVYLPSFLPSLLSFFLIHSSLCIYFLLIYFLNYLLLSELTHFQAIGHWRRPNLALVFSVTFMLELEYILRMHVSFCCVCFSSSVLSQEIGWEERLRNDLFCVGWNINQSISHFGSSEICILHQFYTSV